MFRVRLFIIYFRHLSSPQHLPYLSYLMIHHPVKSINKFHGPVEPTPLHLQFMIKSLSQLTHFSRIISKLRQQILTLCKGNSLNNLILPLFVLPNIPFIEHSLSFINNFSRPSLAQNSRLVNINRNSAILTNRNLPILHIKSYPRSQHNFNINPSGLICIRNVTPYTFTLTYNSLSKTFLFNCYCCLEYLFDSCVNMG